MDKFEDLSVVVDNMERSALDEYHRGRGMRAIRRVIKFGGREIQLTVESARRNTEAGVIEGQRCVFKLDGNRISRDRLLSNTEWKL